ncbi:MAG: hypothetical protein CSA64_01600 [Arachnia propionica]|nr:MAG: hypothetical protein CSA64_01600 [Arachnia propionica]
MAIHGSLGIAGGLELAVTGLELSGVWLVVARLLAIARIRLAEIMWLGKTVLPAVAGLGAVVARLWLLAIAGLLGITVANLPIIWHGCWRLRLGIE